MKKFLFTLIALAMSVVTMAGHFVMLPYSGRAELEKHFSDPNLTVHYYNNSEVFATAERFDASTMVLIDRQAFEDNDVYALVYCPASEQEAYIGEGEALLRMDNYIIAKGGRMPYKNDGAVVIFNKKASLPRLTRDFPVVTWTRWKPLCSTCRTTATACGTPTMPLQLPIGLQAVCRPWVLKWSSSLSMPTPGLEVVRPHPMLLAFSVVRFIRTLTWCVAAISILSRIKPCRVELLPVPTTTLRALPACWRARES